MILQVMYKNGSRPFIFYNIDGLALEYALRELNPDNNPIIYKLVLTEE